MSRHRVDEDTGCWIWTGSCTSSGYGQFPIGAKKKYKAHRWGYELLVGPIPEGLVLDHLCRNIKCVNPEHLEPVTQAENLARGANRWVLQRRSGKCMRGHDLTDDNVYVVPAKPNSRACVTCTRERRKQRWLRELAARSAA